MKVTGVIPLTCRRHSINRQLHANLAKRYAWPRTRRRQNVVIGVQVNERGICVTLS